MWVNHYRPRSFEELDCHLPANKILKRLSKSPDLPHLYIYGPEGSGRHTRVLCLIKELFGLSSPPLLQPSICEYTTNADKQVEFPYVASSHHIEICPADAGSNNDSNIIMSIIKEAAKTKAVDAKFKVIVIQDSDRLSFNAQQALRRLMEVYSKTCKLIFISHSISGVIEPITSRCQAIRIPSFTDSEIETSLMSTLKKAMKDECERLNDDTSKIIPLSVMREVVDKAGGNMRKGLLLFQAAIATTCTNISDILPDWEVSIENLVQKHIFINESGKKQARQALQYEETKQIKGEFIQDASIESLRRQLIELLKRAIPAEMILLRIYNSVLANIKKYLSNDVVKMSLIVSTATRITAKYDARLKAGTNPIYHLEPYVLSLAQLML